MAISDRVAVLRGGKVVLQSATSDTRREVLAEAMVGRAIPQPKRTPMETGHPLLSLDEVSVLGDRGKALLDQVTLTLKAHEILGIAGVSGNGQLQLAELLSGLKQPDKGYVVLEGVGAFRPSPRVMVRHGIGRISYNFV